MNDVKSTVIIHADKPTSPSRIGASTGSTGDLPADLIEAGRRRLAAVAIIYVFGYVVMYTIARITGAPAWQGSERALCVPDYISLFCVLFAGLVVFVARNDRLRISPRSITWIGLVFLVVGAFGVDMWWIWNPFGPDFRPTGISWGCVWIVLFPMVMPMRPSRLVLPSLLAASALPAAVMIAIARGAGPVPLPILVFWFAPNYLCALISFKAACVVHSWGRDVKKAREMGSYRLVRLLGEGGMGEVWLAKHRMLARPAAIKLIRPERLGVHGGGSTSSTTVRRFEREAQATAALHSYHTVELYDFGRTEDGTFYYVMELLDGLNLEAMVKQFGPLPPERAASLLEQACDALADAHHSGLIHRDIKPANIYVCRKGLRYDVAKVLDFGLVKATNDAAKSDGRLTIEGITTGTPAYIAPETGLGDQQIDGRTDLYSLGCVGYWLLTGELVFENDSPMKMVIDHIHTPPVPPSERTEIEIPVPLERLIMSCLEKDPANRPQSAAEMAAELRAAELSRRWTNERAEHWWQSHLPQSLCGGDRPGATGNGGGDAVIVAES